MNVGVKQIGVQELMDDQIYELHPGDVLEILLGKYLYEIIFETGTSAKSSSTNSENIDVSSVVPSEAGSSMNGVWENVDQGKLLIFTQNNVKASNKMAGYDLDGTIITTKSEKKFPQDVDDWKFFPYISRELTSLHQEGYKIVFFTNQNGISLGKYKVEDYKKKTEAIVKKLNIPIQVFAATGKSIYRKPRIGMWNYLCERQNESIKIDKNESFFVGDAAGRDANIVMKTKKDHSAADRLFAMNVCIKFFTKEEHFKKHSKSTWLKPLFDPKNFVAPSSLLNPPDSKLVSTELEIFTSIIIECIVGFPGSGKSSFSKNHLVPNGYKWINQDTLKTWQNCVKQLENAISAKQNSVIDNTNPSKESRKRYIDVAKKFGVRCRCFVMDVSLPHSKHNNIFRELTDSTHKPINEIVMNSFKKYYQAPTVDGGFSEVVKVNLIPKFKNLEDECIKCIWLILNTYTHQVHNTILNLPCSVSEMSEINLY